MQTETMSNRANTEQNTQRQSWCKPDLIDYGTVGDLTQGGTIASTGESSYITSV